MHGYFMSAHGGGDRWIDRWMDARTVGEDPLPPCLRVMQFNEGRITLKEGGGIS